MRRVLRPLKRWLILGHRWLGIATGLFLATWVLSGLVMIYVGFPALTEAERLGRLAPIAWDRVRLGPDEALARAGLLGAPEGVSLAMRGEIPVYGGIEPGGAHRVVSAETGALLGPLTAAETATRFPKAVAIRTVHRDQWTVTARYDPVRPFHVVELGDADGTELTLSQATGAVVLDTTRRERLWNWFGAVPHWIYWTPLRAQGELWRDVVLWLSGFGIAAVASGLALGMWRVRLRRRYPSGAVTPYRGLARWHHLFGLAGGATLLTFVASGWLSMNPNRWFSSAMPSPAMIEAYRGEAPPVELDALRRLALPETVEIHIGRVAGQPVVVASDARGHRRVAAEGETLTPTSLAAAARRMLPEAGYAEVETLGAYDAYWYPHHEGRALPVLRVRLDDPAATWLHLDPETGEILGRLDRSGRINRWLFDAPHRLDFAILTRARPAWDFVMWGLNLLGAGLAVTGLVLGWRRLALGRRRLRR